jgi:hypothetical protein
MDLLEENIPRYNDELYNEELIKNKKSKGKPHAILTMGSSGSGKSYELKKYKYYSNYLVIDYDEIALQLPELLYNQENGIYDSRFMYKNYSLISKYTENIYRKAVSSKCNLICHSVIPHQSRIINLLSNGYNVTILYKKDVNINDVLKNRKERLLRTNLYTKIEIVTENDIKKLKKELGLQLKIENMDTWIRNTNIK